MTSIKFKVGDHVEIVKPKWETWNESHLKFIGP